MNKNLIIPVIISALIAGLLGGLAGAAIFASQFAEPGPAGPQGEQGPQGPQGEQGPVGPQGLPGESADNNISLFDISNWPFGCSYPRTETITIPGAGFFGGDRTITVLRC